MPLYEYECLTCGLHFDRLQRFGEAEPSSCPNGHSHVHRLLSQPAIIFKGSGFYVTDNRRGSQLGPPRRGRHNGAEESGKTAQAERQVSLQRDDATSKGEG